MILPDSTILIDYLQPRATELVNGDGVDVDACVRTWSSTHGALFSQRSLLALVEREGSRDDAYRMVQELAQRAWDEEDRCGSCSTTTSAPRGSISMPSSNPIEYLRPRPGGSLARLDLIA